MARRLDGEPGLGLGDAKLVAALALWLGSATAYMILLATLLGLTVAVLGRAGPRQPLAFGPMIAAAGWAVGVAKESGAFAWMS
jgi:leader peptidase (prepilin peptidase)/N-methyltransferase